MQNITNSSYQKIGSITKFVKHSTVGKTNSFRKVNLMIWPIKLSLAVFLMLTGLAQAGQRCAEALILDKGSLDLTEASSLALFSYYKRTIATESDGQFAITVPIYGVPVNLSASNKEKALDRAASAFSGNFSQQRQISLATQTLSRNSVTAYQSCLDQLANKAVSVVAYDATQDAVTIEIRWNSPPDAPPVTNAVIIVEEGVVKQKFPSKWKTGMTFATVIKRVAGKDTRIIANIGGASENVTIFWMPKLSISRERRTEYINGEASGSRWRLSNDGSGRETRTGNVCKNSPDGWYIVTGTASTNIETLVGHIDDRTYARITRKTDTQVCFQARMYPLSKGGGGDLWFRPSYEIERILVSNRP